MLLVLSDGDAVAIAVAAEFPLTLPPGVLTATWVSEVPVFSLREAVGLGASTSGLHFKMSL